MIGGRWGNGNGVLFIHGLLFLDAITLVGLGTLVRIGPLALASIVAWGIAAFALVPPLQHRVTVQAKMAPNLASTLNQSAFNLGDALGAALGATVLANGSGYSLAAVDRCRRRLSRPPARVPKQRRLTVASYPRVARAPIV